MAVKEVANTNTLAEALHVFEIYSGWSSRVRVFFTHVPLSRQLLYFALFSRPFFTSVIIRFNK